jgi:hypothetical protein
MMRALTIGLMAAVLCGTTRRVIAGDDPATPDVRHYDIAVSVGDATITETVTLHAVAARPPESWSLDLAPEMKVVAAESGGKPLPFATKERAVELDLRPLDVKAGAEFAVTLRVEGAPHEIRRIGEKAFVRSAVKPSLVYVRSQHAWYPQNGDDAATYRTVVDVPKGWSVRTAGRFKDPDDSKGRLVWTFDRDAPGRPIGLIAGNFHSVSPSPAAVDALVLSPEHGAGAAAAITVASNAVLDYGERFGKLRDARLTLVEVPEEFGLGCGYGEEGYLLLAPDAFDAKVGDWIEPFVAHETAHAWWGHAVPFSDFGSEALANWSALTFLDGGKGGAAARAMRSTAVDRVASLASSGKEIALSAVTGFGAGMDYGVYDTLAYQKAMMVLVMAGEALGEDAMRKLVAKFFESRRGATSSWADVRAALAAGGADAKTLVEAWDAPGVPTLAVESQTKKSGAKSSVVGKLTQSGTTAPRPMWVRVVATCGKKTFTATVKLVAAETTFTIPAPAEPDSVVFDPDFLVLATRASAGSVDSEKLLAGAFAVVNDPGDDDAAHCAKALADLRTALASGDEKFAGQCHVGIGRLLFRTGKLDDAKTELETALRVGGFGPFHRSWTLLRLGCIADLAKKRDDAVARYKAVVELKGANDFVVQKAKALMERAYRGYEKDR